MALAVFSLERATDALHTTGFYSEDDLSLGIRVSEMKHAFLSPEGLEFYKANILKDHRIRDTLKSVLTWCGLARYRKFHADPGHIFQFRAGGERAGQCVLVVQLWGSGSKVEYWDGSQTHSLPGVKASNGLWEVPLAALTRAGCTKRSTITFEHGGLTIQDGRTAYGIERGTPIATIFATRDILPRWTKLILSNTPDLRRKVDEIETESPDIGLHIQLQDTAAGNDESPGALDSATASSN